MICRAPVSLRISSFISSAASSPLPLFSPFFLRRLAVAVHCRRTPPNPALISLFFFLSVTSFSSLFLSQATNYLAVAKCLLRRPSPQLPSISSSPCFSLPAPPTSSSPSSSPSTDSSSRASLLRSGKALGFLCRRSLTASTTYLPCRLFLLPSLAVAILHRRDPDAVALSSSTAADLLGFSVLCRRRAVASSAVNPRCHWRPLASLFISSFATGSPLLLLIPAVDCRPPPSSSSPSTSSIASAAVSRSSAAAPSPHLRSPPLLPP